MGYKYTIRISKGDLFHRVFSPVSYIEKINKSSLYSTSKYALASYPNHEKHFSLLKTNFQTENTKIYYTASLPMLSTKPQIIP